jgi:hypothetical protein
MGALSALFDYMRWSLLNSWALAHGMFVVVWGFFAALCYGFLTGGRKEDR